MNEKYIPLYRKYRPQKLEQVVGQEHIKKALKNAIELDKISHAYLFTGPRGTGKTSTARIFAKRDRLFRLAVFVKTVLILQIQPLWM